MRRYLGHLIRSAERRVEHFLNAQVLDRSREDFGAMRGDVIEGKPTIYALAAAVSVYCNRDSRYYHDKELLESMNLAMDFIGRWQRDNGALDYPTCNFNSAADTSFCFKRLIAAYRVLELYEPAGADKQVETLREKYRFVMRRSLEMIRTGGFHTPNHRWGITAALMQGAGLFPDLAPELMARAGQYLAEGIDGSADGEYAERSTGNYNAVVNNAMMAMYEESGDPDYLGYVARNLHMMLTYIDPDGTIFTQNSTRQDQGKADYPDKYFYQYLFMASLPEEKLGEYGKYREEFDAAAHRIIRDNQERGDLAPDCLHIVMAHKAMYEHVFAGCGFPDTYRKYFRDAGVLRVKNERYGYSVLSGKSAFLYIKFGELPLFVKIGESVGSCRNFIPETMEVEEGKCTLKSTVYTSYYQPFGEFQGTNDWWKMDHASREILNNARLDIQVEIAEAADGLSLRIKAEGLSRVPLRVQVCAPKDAVLEHDCFHLRTDAGGWMILKSGMAKLRLGDRTVEFGPGFGTHEFGGHYSGEEVYASGYTVYLNEYTPFEKTVDIRRVAAGNRDLQ